MRDAVIVEAIRTPIGKRGGVLSGVHPVDLSAQVLSALIERTGVDSAVVEDVVWGCVTQVGEQAANVARSAVLAAGWDEDVVGVTVDRQCGSSQQAAQFAAATVVAGHYDVVVAGGVESMSRVPMFYAVESGPGEAYGPLLNARYEHQLVHQGLSAELVAERWQLDRVALDEIALRSHERAIAAMTTGAFDAQLAAVKVEDGGGEATSDQGPRADCSAEGLAGLAPAFRRDGVITAGNSSQISDGASAMLITTSEKARQLGLKPMARFHTFATAGVDPVMMLAGPIPATRRLVERSGVSLDEIGAFEVNEAFASVVGAWLATTGVPHERVNPLGGAIALGHPLGASGGCLTARLVHHMRDNGLRYGLQTMCEGGGMANATLFEVLDC